MREVKICASRINIILKDMNYKNKQHIYSKTFDCLVEDAILLPDWD